MRLKTAQLGLPLLARELLELSARRRTYIVRVLYACLLFFSAFLMFYDTLRANMTTAFGVLGRGRVMYETIIGLQFAGVYLFMPAITCGVLTLEKERNSFALILLTKLGPWTILFEKLLSRLITMGGFLLLSVPLLAFAYTLGGISQDYFWSGVWLLAVTSVQVGTLSLACSAYFRTTVAAFIASYLLGFLMLFGWSIANELTFLGFATVDGSPLVELCKALRLIDHHFELPMLFFGPMLFFDQFSGMSTPGGTGPTPWYAVLANSVFCMSVYRSLPILMMSAGWLFVARVFIVRRAFAQPRNVLARLFRSLDQFFVKANDNRLTRGIVLIREESNIPDNEPVAWRETTKKSMGTWRHLFRILAAIEIPIVVLLSLITAVMNTSHDMDSVSAMLFILWPIAVLMVSVKSASLVSSERSHQTLDVLLATPLVGRYILEQKYRGVQRMIRMLWLPFLTIILFESTFKGILADGTSNGYAYRHEFSLVAYLVGSLLSVLIYLPLIAWTSFYIGLKARTQMQAIIGSLIAIVGWCVIPLLIIFLPLSIFMSPDPGLWGGLTLLSPMMILPLTEFNALHEIWGRDNHVPQLLTVLLNYAWYGAILWFVRSRCLTQANRLLGRSEGLAASSESSLMPPNVWWGEVSGLGRLGGQR